MKTKSIIQLFEIWLQRRDFKSDSYEIAASQALNGVNADLVIFDINVSSWLSYISLRYHSYYICLTIQRPLDGPWLIYVWN